MNNFFDNQRILQVIWKRRIHFMIVGGIAVLLSAIFSSSFFITPKFKSTARIYPTNLWPLSNESETEQMLEIVNSQDIKLRMFDAFNLAEVYNINREDPLFLTYLLNLYNTHVGASKTEFETVEIKVLDKDPLRAAQMCDSIIRFYNEKVQQMHAAKNWEMVEISQKGLEKRTRELDSLLERINQTRSEYQILDYSGQVKEITRGYMEVLAAGRENSTGSREIKRLYDNLANKGTEAWLQESKLAYLTMVIDSLNTVHEFNRSEAEKKISYCYVVQKPVPADKKAYPIRWLIVAFSTLSALFAALLVFVVLDFRKVN